MNTFVHRYELDTSRPEGKQFWRDLAVRALAPALALWCVIVGLGFLIVEPLGDLPAGDGVEGWFAERRTPVMNTVTEWVGHLGMTEVIIGTTLVTAAYLWWRTRQWWFAVVPAIAVFVQAAIFLTSSLVVARERPDVEQLDDAPPTSSFPSGHTGAASALWFTLALLAQRLENRAARWAVTVLCLLVPFAVGVSRLYRGMHGPADVAAGLLNGAVCVVLAWGYLRRDTRQAKTRR